MTQTSTKVRNLSQIHLLDVNILPGTGMPFVWLSDGTFNPFGTFKFTGTLRPVYPLSPKREVPPHIPRPDYAEDGTMNRVLSAIQRTM